MKTKDSNFYSYISLAFILSLGVIFAVLSGGDKMQLRFIVGSLAICYFIWGYLHHSQKEKFRKQIMVEYFLFAVLGAALTFALL